MKRIRVITFAAFCLLAAVSMILGSSAAGASYSYLLGDADGNGDVELPDATVIQRKLAHLPIDAFHDEAADVDGDGLSITDVTQIQRYLADFVNIYNIGEPVTVPGPTAPKPTRNQFELPVV